MQCHRRFGKIFKHFFELCQQRDDVVVQDSKTEETQEESGGSDTKSNFDCVEEQNVVEMLQDQTAEREYEDVKLQVGMNYTSKTTSSSPSHFAWMCINQRMFLATKE